MKAIIFHTLAGMKALAMLLDAVLPPRCPFTGEIVDKAGTVAPEAWAQLSFIADPVCHACGFPFEFAVPAGSTEALCASCLYERPEFNSARSALVYNDASRDLILGFKHGDQLQSVVVMIPWLMHAGANIIKDADIVVPVPLHRWRLLKRRYNQAALIAHSLSKRTKKPFSADALVRVRSTPTQGHLNAKDRQKNVSRAFAIPEKRRSAILGKNVLLIDDVYTTGSTVRECARALLNCGAAQVNVLTVARVVKAGKLS